MAMEIDIDAAFLLALFIVGITTYIAYKEKRAVLLAGLAWIGVSVISFVPVDPDLAMLGVFIGLLLSFWGVYIYAFGHT